MVLMRDQEDAGGSSQGKLQAKLSNSPQIHPRITYEPPDCPYSAYDEHLDSCEYSEDDCEDYDELGDSYDTRSITSDDSFYPPDEELTESESECAHVPGTLSLFRACCSNTALTVKALIRQGVTEEEVRETDKNNRVRASRQRVDSFGTTLYREPSAGVDSQAAALL